MGSAEVRNRASRARRGGLLHSLSIALSITPSVAFHVSHAYESKILRDHNSISIPPNDLTSEDKQAASSWPLKLQRRSIGRQRHLSYCVSSLNKVPSTGMSHLCLDCGACIISFVGSTSSTHPYQSRQHISKSTHGRAVAFANCASCCSRHYRHNYRNHTLGHVSHSDWYFQIYKAPAGPAHLGASFLGTLDRSL
jgi:hypothetical protein